MTIANATAYRGSRGMYADFTRPFAAGGYSGAVALARGADASMLIFASGSGYSLAEHALSNAGVGTISFETGAYAAAGGATTLNKVSLR